MKKLYSLLVMVVLGIASASAITYYTPEEFDPAKWQYIGMGNFEPGIFDYYGNEYPEVVECYCYQSKTEEGLYWMEPITPYDPEDDEAVDAFHAEFLGIAGAFTINVANPDKVYCSPIWVLHPFIFCFFQTVPELMGLQGSADWYGHLDGFRSTFPANAFALVTDPTGTPRSNRNGTFAVTIADASGISSVDAEASAPVYYNLQGVEVANPAPGQIYIAKQGNKTAKVRF